MSKKTKKEFQKEPEKGPDFEKNLWIKMCALNKLINFTEHNEVFGNRRGHVEEPNSN